MQNQLISQAKISRPQVQGIYLRENFFNILDDCRSKPVIWLTAPPGSGKTTLISSYIDSRNLPCLWYQVDGNDNDPATFFHYLGLSAVQGNPGRKNPLPHFTPEYVFGLPAFTEKYFSELYCRVKAGSFIVFDNYQESPNASILHDIIHGALTGIPDGVNVVFLSRSSPPPILSRLRLKNLMEVITWNEIRLTSEEAFGIAAVKGVKDISDARVRSLLSKTDGWVAGFILLLESGKPESLPSGLFEDKDHGELFDYFSEKLFKKLKESERDFLLLASLLPSMTAQMAEELTGNKHSSRILASLNSKGYFIHKHPGAKTRYQLQPLFRDFLLTRLRAAGSSIDITLYSKKAADLLAADLQFDEAVTLFCNSGDFGSIAGIICSEAAPMLEQGRHMTIIKWLDLLPEDMLNKDPWLLFWNGNSFMPYDQQRGHESFKAAFDLFEEAGDRKGMLLSWSGVVDSIIHAFDDLKPLDRWISKLDEILRKDQCFPSEEIEARVTLFMFLALSFRAPHHPDMRLWVEKTYAIFNHIPSPNLKARFGLCMVDYFIWIGDLQKADFIISQLSRADGYSEYTPVSKLSIKLSESLNNWLHGRFDECIATVSDGLQISETTGIRIFDYFFYGHGAVSSLTSGNPSAAGVYVEKAASVLNENMRFCSSYYHHIVACQKLFLNDPAGALEHEKFSLALSTDVGSPFAEAMNRTGMALIEYTLGDKEKAYRESSLALELARKTGSVFIEYIANLFNAYFALDSGERDKAAETLREAMSVGRAKEFLNFHMWHTDVMAKLIVLALEEGIEDEYACRLIRLHDIFPDKAPLHLPNWPWRLKISLSGGMKVRVDGEPLQFKRKTPKMPIEMLRLLTVFGGKDIPEHRISDILWPEADGDAAHDVFTTTLKRLRRLINVDNALLFTGGSLSLNPVYCYTDLWGFDALLDKFDESRGAGGSLDELTALLDEAFGIYKGGFGTAFDEIPGVVSISKRRRNRITRSLISGASLLEEAGELDRAVELYRRGIEIDNVCEELYQRIMICHDKLGRKRDVAAIYNQVSKLFGELGAKPSKKTESIYLEICGSAEG